MNNISFIKFYYMYDIKNYSSCLDILENEKDSLLNIFPEFFINIIKMKIHIINNTFIDNNFDISIIDNYINSSYKEELKYCFSFILAEYIYKFLNEDDLLYDYLMAFCLSSDCDDLVKRYMLDWSTEKNLGRKIGMLDEVFNGFTVDFHEYLKDTDINIRSKNS